MKEVQKEIQAYEEKQAVLDHAVSPVASDPKASEEREA